MPFTGGSLVASCQLGMRRDSWSTSSLRASNCATSQICMKGRCAWQATFARGAVYDAHYLALADILGCEYWTADERFYRAVLAACRNVRWIGEFTAAE